VFLSALCGCKEKQGAAAADLPVHEQLMLVLQESARQRCELSEARVKINRVNVEFAAELKTHKAALAQIEIELAAMRAAFKAAQAGKKEHIEYKGISYSGKNFRLRVGQELSRKKNIETRVASHTGQSALYGGSIQKIALQLHKLSANEEEAKANINDIRLGGQIAGIEKLLKSVAAVDAAAATQTAKDLENPNTITSAAEAAVEVKEHPQRAAETDAFLNN
jgi:hypothetical protein